MSRRKHKGRPVSGIFLLDKPRGLTSNQALQQVKRLFQAQKAGHTGSLDPLATGLLPICLGEATKMSGFLLNAKKSYQVRCQLGVCTDSGDADGQVTERTPVPSIPEQRILDVLKTFLGEIEQVPPMHSALKKDGVPLYKLAHQGISVDREARQVMVDVLQLIRRDGDFLDFYVRCSKGTYIRTLVEDIGQCLGTGAHVVELRRLSVDPYDTQGSTGSTMFSLDELQRHSGDFDALDGFLLGPDSALVNWPKIDLGQEASFYVRQGQSVFVPRAQADGLVRLYNREGGFLGVGEFKKDGKISPKRLMTTSKIG